MMMMMMAKPVKPKTLKPKTGGEDGEGGEAEETANTSSPKSAPSKGGGGGTSGLLSIIILSVVMLFSSIAGPVAALYFLGPQLLSPIIAKIVPAEKGEGEAPGGEGVAEGGEPHAAATPKKSVLGLNLPLEEFTVNLKKDPALRGAQYLRAKMNLSIVVPEAEDCSPHAAAEGEHAEKKAEGGGEGGGHGGGGEGAAAPVDPAKACNEAFVAKMAPFTPTLRDIVNTALMKRSAAEIGTLEGQELLKDEMSQEMNNILSANHYQVVRVNFEEFIVQR